MHQACVMWNVTIMSPANKRYFILVLYSLADLDSDDLDVQLIRTAPQWWLFTRLFDCTTPNIKKELKGKIIINIAVKNSERCQNTPHFNQNCHLTVGEPMDKRTTILHCV